MIIPLVSFYNPGKNQKNRCFQGYRKKLMARNGLVVFYFCKSFRSCHQACSVKKGVLKNFAKFAGKHPCQSLFFNKVAGLSPEACNFIKKGTLAQVFSCEFCEIFENTLFTEHVWTTASKRFE